MIKNALILAAGKGSRMWPLSENIPKPLLPLGGLPIIERQIQELISVGVKELYILIGYRMKEISDYLDNAKLDININYIFTPNNCLMKLLITLSLQFLSSSHS